MTDRTITNALQVLERRKALPRSLRLPRLDPMAAQLRQAAQDEPDARRTLVVALKVLELAAVEAVHAAGVQATERARRQATVAGRARAAGAAGDDVKAIRAWARENGHQVPRRGRYLPADVIAAYRAAQEAS